MIDDLNANRNMFKKVPGVHSMQAHYHCNPGSNSRNWSSVDLWIYLDVHQQIRASEYEMFSFFGVFRSAISPTPTVTYGFRIMDCCLRLITFQLWLAVLLLFIYACMSRARCRRDDMPFVLVLMPIVSHIASIFNTYDTQLRPNTYEAQEKSAFLFNFICYTQSQIIVNNQ